MSIFVHLPFQRPRLRRGGHCSPFAVAERRASETGKPVISNVSFRTISRQFDCSGVSERCKALALHATWLATFSLLSTLHALSNLTFHVARFLSDSLYASNTRYNGLHLFGGSYGHASHPDTACGHPACR